MNRRLRAVKLGLPSGWEKQQQGLANDKSHELGQRYSAEEVGIKAR